MTHWGFNVLSFSCVPQEEEMSSMAEVFEERLCELVRNYKHFHHRRLQRRPPWPLSQDIHHQNLVHSPHVCYEGSTVCLLEPQIILWSW